MTELWASIQRDAETGTIDLTRRYSTTPEDLWDAITSPARAARWLGVVTGDLHEGGNYLIMFDEEDDSQRNYGIILACEAPHHLRLSWQGPAEPDTVVDVSLTPDEGGTVLHLAHSRLPHGADVDHAAGWQVHLAMLEQSLTGDVEPGTWDAWHPLRIAYAAGLQG